MSEIVPQWTTHTSVEFRGDTVIKRFRRYRWGEPEREWRALTLLSEYAPGLAPTPLWADLGAEPPVVVMSRLDGVPLGPDVVVPSRIKALAETISLMNRAIPPRVIAEVPIRPFHELDTIDQIRQLHRQHDPAKHPFIVDRAVDDGLTWLSQSGLADDRTDMPVVFGSGDGNLANYLWNGSGAQVVDFEHSGRSDRAFELAEITENETVQAADFDESLFLQQFDLSTKEASRLRQCRRLLALANLLLLESAASRASSPGAIERRASRLLDLLA